MTDILNNVNQVTRGNVDSTLQEYNPSKSETDGSKLAEDFDQFLLLLTTQLKNQDPTEPLDVNEMTNQLVLFSGVEQQILGNQHLENLIAAQEGSAFDDAVQYIGKYVDAQGRAGELRAEDGEASFAYNLGASASDVDVIITNASGRAVFVGNGSGQFGKNLVAWDGTNSFTGAQEPPGTYFINVEAKAANGDVVDVDTLTTGEVTGATYNQQGDLVLNVAGTEVALKSVEAVRSAPKTVTADNES